MLWTQQHKPLTSSRWKGSAWSHDTTKLFSAGKLMSFCWKSKIVMSECTAPWISHRGQRLMCSSKNHFSKRFHGIRQRAKQNHGDTWCVFKSYCITSSEMCAQEMMYFMYYSEKIIAPQSASTEWEGIRGPVKLLQKSCIPAYKQRCEILIAASIFSLELRSLFWIISHAPVTCPVPNPSILCWHKTRILHTRVQKKTMS